MINNVKFKLVLQQYKNKIYSYCRHILKDKMDADDATQDVMIRFWENMDQINMLNIKTWLYTTAYHRCIDTLRKRKLEYERRISFDETVEELIPAPERENPDLYAEVNQEIEFLLIAINKLPDEQKNVLIMYEIQGLKYREISDIMNLPLNTVKVYIMRARKNLHTAMKGGRGFTNGKM